MSKDWVVSRMRNFFSFIVERKNLNYPNQLCVCPNNKVPHSIPENLCGTFWARESPAGRSLDCTCPTPEAGKRWKHESSLSLSLSGGLLCLNSVASYARNENGVKAFHFNFTCLGCLAWFFFSSGSNLADLSNFSFVLLPCKTEWALVYSSETLSLPFSALLYSITGPVV